MTMGELLQRHLTIKKLSTSPPDASRLVRELIERSAAEVGFEPNELPVMVEAVKNAEGDMVFTVTKINSPEELPPHLQPQPDLFRAFHGLAKALLLQREEQQIRQPRPLSVFAFYGRDSLCVPPRLKELPSGLRSSLYYFADQDIYYLLVTAPPRKKEEFDRVCLLLSEYGRRIPSTSASEAYYAENGETLYASHAIEQILAGMKSG